MPGPRRPGVRLLRRVLWVADGRAESPGETMLRLFHHCLDIHTTPQVLLADGHGRLVGRADLLVTGTRNVHEYDGSVHRSARAHRSDLRRDRGWIAGGYTRRGFTLSDLLTHPTVTAQELDRALGRPHDPSRVRRWQRLVDDSLYSPLGRARIMNRRFRIPTAR